jgi:alkylation response protein AidB-like acyl-CoA dehydrogenase
MEFGWTVEQVRLRDEARAFAQDAVVRFGRANDSWINGFSREVSRERGARGWIGMGWP